MEQDNHNNASSDAFVDEEVTETTEVVSVRSAFERAGGDPVLERLFEAAASRDTDGVAAK